MGVNLGNSWMKNKVPWLVKVDSDNVFHPKIYLKQIQ